MYPTIHGQVAQDHVRSLIAEADAARLARSAVSERPSPGVRRRIGLHLISLGTRLAPEAPRHVARVHGDRY